jgi:opacity protein-like surface antigen
VRVTLGIERFELDCKHGWAGPRDGTFRARMAVTALTDSGETPAGWIEADEESPGGASKGLQERLMYQGMVGMAQGFERLSLARPTAGSAVATDASAAPSRQTVTSKYQDPWTLRTTQWWDVSFVQHGLTGGQMKDSYRNVQGIMSGGGAWLKEGRAGLGGEVGFLTGKGDARVLDPAWTLRKRELSMWAVPVSMTGYFRLLDPKRTLPVMPYLGAGLGAFFGVDKLEIDAVGGLQELSGFHRALRAGWEGHALAGAEIGVSEDLHVMLETQWTQAGKAWIASGVDEKNAEEVQFWNTLHSILERPDNDLTGWRIALGLRWVGGF